MKPLKKYDIGKVYLQKFPETPTKSIARLMAKDHPTLFSVESARSCLRFLRGNDGKANRKKVQDPSFFRESKSAGKSYFGKIPEPIIELEDWHIIELENVGKALILQDVHVPFHDESFIVALNHGVAEGCDTVILAGDFVDFFSVSYFRRNPHLVQFKEEIEIIRQTLSAIREMFPKAQLVFKEGNHEERMESYLMCRAPELLGVADFELRSFLRLEEMGYQYVGEKRPLRIDKLHIIHGHEFAHSVYNPVNPARGYFLRAKDITIGGHYHQTSEHTEASLSGQVTSVWSTGCLCNLRPKFRPINKWNHGFATVDMTSGKFRVDNYRVIEGQIY